LYSEARAISLCNEITQTKKGEAPQGVSLRRDANIAVQNPLTAKRRFAQAGFEIRVSYLGDSH
jgi:hypothetical protein